MRHSENAASRGNEVAQAVGHEWKLTLVISVSIAPLSIRPVLPAISFAVCLSENCYDFTTDAR